MGTIDAKGTPGSVSAEIEIILHIVHKNQEYAVLSFSRTSEPLYWSAIASDSQSQRIKKVFHR